MPEYDYKCDHDHRAVRLRTMSKRDDPLACEECGGAMTLTMSRSHVAPDGVYSYAPNVGDPERFERQREHIKARKEGGPRVMKREPSKADLERWNN